MGVVDLARHCRTGQIVALKSVRLRSPKLIASFRREVHALASLSHPGIVRIFDHGVVDGMPWYAMELVDGQTLARRMAGPSAPLADYTAPHRSTERSESSTQPAGLIESSHGPMSLAEVCALFQPICRALGFLHCHGLVHRDLKPENILLRPSGAPVLVDFGLVAQCGGSASREVLELADAGVGTVAYMAPEQRLGRFVDARADLFSLGCILYECLTGILPFGTMGPRSLASESPPLPSSKNAEIPPQLDTIVLGLLAKDPRVRLGYADDVASALANLSDSRSPPSARSSIYLYRPDLVGRDALLSRLDRTLGDALVCGQGALVLVTGESGVGKTRLVNELAAKALENGLTVVTGECAPVGASAREGPTPCLPLAPFRGLLLTVADACLAGGEGVTQRLLGDTFHILAPYEPALAALPGQSEAPDHDEFPADSARARLFASLWGTMADLARERPMLLVLDDLQWADELSLAFLSSLSPTQIATTPLVIVGTCRIEEMNDELRALAAKDGVMREHVTRFDRESVRQMVAGMLAMPTPPSELVEFLHVESSGNPFFIAEYPRASITERILRRDGTGRWILDFTGEFRDSRHDPTHHRIARGDSPA